RRNLLPTFRTEMQLGPDDRVRFLSLASSAHRQSRVPSELFDVSQELSRQDGGIFWYLTSLSLATQAPRDSSRRVADAVAVAGLRTELAAQHIVWLDGRHLPQSIALTPAAARGVELPTAPAP